MDEALTYGGSIRRLWVGEAELYRGHLLHLDAESRRNRFGGAVSDDFIRGYCESRALSGAIIYGFFVDDVLRGAAELRLLEPAGDAEVALSIERDMAEPRRGNGAARAPPARGQQPADQPAACALPRRKRAHAAARAQIRRRAEHSIRQCGGRNESPASDADVGHARARGRQRRPCAGDTSCSIAARKAA